MTQLPTTYPCDYCDAPDAPANMLNIDLMLHQFSIETTARTSYEMARYGATSNKPSTSEEVEALIREVMPQYNVFKNITVRICEPCRLADAHADDRDTPVFGVNCVSNEARTEMLAKVRAFGEADRLEDERRAQWRHPSTY